MKEEFVTYEIAVKLRELGFNEECLGFYKTTLGDNVPELHIIKCNYNSGKYITIPEDFHTDAPLWQQVIDWLREKHNLLIDSPKLDEWNTGKWSVKLESLDKKIILEEHVGQPYWRIYRGFDSYEKAKEQAILKAIELCQNKK